MRKLSVSKGVLSQAHLSFQNKHCSGQKGTVRTLQRAQCAQCSGKKGTSKGTNYTSKLVHCSTLSSSWTKGTSKQAAVGKRPLQIQTCQKEDDRIQPKYLKYTFDTASKICCLLCISGPKTMMQSSTLFESHPDY